MVHYITGYYFRKHFKAMFLILCAGFFSVHSLYGQADNAQTRRFSGMVVNNETSQPIAGATIRNMSSAMFTASNTNGEFNINGQIGDELNVSFVGFRPETVKLENTQRMVIRLIPSSEEMDEVVVIAYGEVKREELTGAVASVNMEDLTKAPVADFERALAGRVAGVQVNSNDGQPGSDMNIVVRGGNSLTQSNSPLYVVDGFPIENFGSASLSPEDIASITVLKDADATSVYGSRAANGVIVIETKQGTAGAPAISYHGFVGVQDIIKKMEMMDSYEYVRYMIERDPVDMYQRFITNESLTLEDYRNQPTADWQDVVFNPAYTQSHWVSLRGGTNQTKYNVSSSLFDQGGIAPNSGFNRYQGRVSLEQKIGQKLTFNVNANYSRVQNYGLLAAEQGSSSNAYVSYLMFQTWGARPVIRPGEDIYNSLFLEGEDNPESLDNLFNPLVAARNQVRQQTRGHLLANAKIDYNITRGLRLTARGGINTRENRNESFYNSRTYQGYPFLNNLRGVRGNFNEVQITNWTTEGLLNYNKRIKRGHRINALFGMSMQGFSNNNYGYGVNNIIREDMGLASLQYGVPSSVIARQSRNLLASYFTRINYNLKGKYLFAASFRADGSSKFAPHSRWGYFPSGSFAWQMGKENFLKNIDFISDAKLRVSYGATGNNRVGDFSQYSTIDLANAYYSFNNEVPVAAARLNNLGARDLRWETTIQSNIGYDLALFDNKVNLVLDVYRKTTKDLLLNADLPGSTGFTSMFRNIGKVSNDGIEIALTTKNISNKSFAWESTFNISFNRNRVRELTFEQEMLLSRVLWTNAYNQSNLYVAQVGQSTANFYGFIWEGNYQYSDFDQNPDGSYTLKPSVPSNGASRSSIMPGDIKYADVNGDGNVNEADMVVIGRALPIHIGGFNNNFSYKGFDLNVFFQWSAGNQIFNANRMLFEGNATNRNVNQYATYVDRWTEDNQNNIYFRTRGQGPIGMYSSRTIEDGSYLRLKTVQLSYNFPKSVADRLKLKNLSTYFSGQDLLTWSKYSGMDPEVSVRNSNLTPGFDWSAYPRAKTFTFGIRTDF